MAILAPPCIGPELTSHAACDLPGAQQAFCQGTARPHRCLYGAFFVKGVQLGAFPFFSSLSCFARPRRSFLCCPIRISLVPPAGAAEMGGTARACRAVGEDWLWQATGML